MSTQMDKLLAIQEKARQKRHKAEMEEKRVSKKIADLARNERTHRLCNRGGYLEKLLMEPEWLTDEDVFAFLDYVFNTPYAKNRLNALLETKRKAEAENQRIGGEQGQENGATSATE